MIARAGFALLVGTALAVGGLGCRDNAGQRPDFGSLDFSVEDLRAAPGADGGADGGADLKPGKDAAGSDAGPPDLAPWPDSGTISTPAAPAEIVSTGTAGLLLRGTVLLPTGAIAGEVLVKDGLIACAQADCSGAAGAADATVIDTKGVISPGLIDAHNHLAYNFLPEWVPNPAKLFNNRYEWAQDPQYEAFILPYAKHRSASTHFCPAAKWGELRSIVHGTTTVQGQSFEQSCVDWGARNADNFHELGYDHMQTNIGSVRDLTDSDAATLIANFDAATDPTTRYAVHMAEGVSGANVDLEFDSFAGRDTRTNRHKGTSLLYKQTAVLIHSIPLTEAQLMEAATTGSKIVWSPSSNLVLYGATAPIQRILQLGITTGLGPDWTPSGEDELLSEMRFALQYGVVSNIPELTTQKLWEMATRDGATVVGLDAKVGRIEVGLRADLVVFARDATDPYRAVIESRAPDVRLVLIDGVGWYGDATLEAATARNTYCDMFEACGAAKYLCVVDSPTATSRRNETYDDLRTQLYNILEGIGYPADEQYGRGSELLPLVQCP